MCGFVCLFFVGFFVRHLSGMGMILPGTWGCTRWAFDVPSSHIFIWFCKGFVLSFIHGAYSGWCAWSALWGQAWMRSSLLLLFWPNFYKRGVAALVKLRDAWVHWLAALARSQCIPQSLNLWKLFSKQPLVPDSCALMPLNMSCQGKPCCVWCWEVPLCLRVQWHL